MGDGFGTGACVCECHSVDSMDASHASSVCRTDKMMDASGYAAMSSAGKMAAG